MQPHIYHALYSLQIRTVESIRKCLDSRKGDGDGDGDGCGDNFRSARNTR